MPFKSGFAVLVGRTNAGKSTLLNALVGRKIAIVSPKPQTTRDTYHGVVHRPGGQIVFVDTPGVFRTSSSRLVDHLHHRLQRALEEIDVVVHVVDPTRTVGPEDQQAAELVSRIEQPRVLCLNKLDLPQRPSREFWLERSAPYQCTVEVSALERKNTEELIRAILALLPEGHPFYSEDQVSNMTREFWIGEIIREKIFLRTGQELPYTATVEVDLVEERTDKKGLPLLCIKAAILTVDDRHQRMFIGQGARKIKEIGTAARQELESALQRKVFLDLAVLVDKRWVEKMK